MVAITFRITSPDRTVLTQEIDVSEINFPTAKHIRLYLEREMFGSVCKFTRTLTVTDIVRLRYQNNGIDDLREESRRVHPVTEETRIHYRTQIKWGFPGEEVNREFTQATYAQHILVAPKINIHVEMDPILAAEDEVVAPGPFPELLPEEEEENQAGTVPGATRAGSESSTRSNSRR